MENIKTDYINLIEFEIEDNISIFYNCENKNWYIEYIDMEDGEEYEEEIDIDINIPLKYGNTIISVEDLLSFKKIVEKELS